MNEVDYEFGDALSMSVKAGGEATPATVDPDSYIPIVNRNDNSITKITVSNLSSALLSDVVAALRTI